MYGTVARIKVKPGKEAELLAMGSDEEMMHIPGFIGQLVYRLDRDPNEFMLVILFTDGDSYFRNANSPEQDARYHKMAELFDGEPEWYDGQVVHAWLTEAALHAQPDVVKSGTT